MGPLAAAGLGIASGLIEDTQQYLFQGLYNNRQMQNTRQLMDYQQQKALEMWEKTGYGATMEQMKKAGLNPGLLYGMSGGGGGTAQMPTAQAPGGQATKNDLVGMGIQLQQAQLLKAQKENIEADTANKKANTPNISADTENKLLQAVILKYAGKEAERQWNINKELSLEEYGAKANTLEATKAIQEQIVKLYEDGTMEKMTRAELEDKIKGINLKDQQIDGQKIANAIAELERKMQETLGLDKNSPGWMKIIGRLLIGMGLIK